MKVRADTRRPAAAGRRWLRLIAAASSACACLIAGADQPSPPGLPELVRTKQRSFAIPFRIPKSSDPDADAAPQKIVLNVSTDMGISWQAAGEAAPSATSFTYRADADGEYWFRLRAVDRKGRSRGGEGPDVRVLVDAAGPRVAGRAWKGADGEIVCRYAAADDSLKLESLKVEYRGPGDNGWKAVAPQAVLARESPAHLVGEEIWWAGEKVPALTIRVSITDSSGNPGTKQFTLEPTDPGIDQAELAREIGVPPLPTEHAADDPAGTRDAAATTSADSSGRSSLSGRPRAQPHQTGAATGEAGWSPEAAGAWADGQPKPAGPDSGPGRSVLVRPTTTSIAALLPQADTRPAPRRQPLGDTGIAQSASGNALEYRGRPLQLTRSRRFAWDYDVPATRPATGPLRAELWTTQDGGVTWQRAAVDNDGRSPIDVALAASGLYGVRLEMVADGSDPSSGSAGPRSGSAPDAWVGVDEEPPQVELVDISRDESTPTGGLIIRYSVRDPLIAPRSVRLLYSPNPDGPWATISATVENQGEHRWTPDTSVPARVFIRAEATDLAGNVGGATSADDISIAAPRFGGRLGGIRPLPTAP
ncbi:MAG: hypothetical protein ACKO4T_12510 [Planctomycetaceae bacterium]